MSNIQKTRMIRWRLRVLMAEKNINNKTLAEITSLHPTTISRLKNTDELKQVSGDVLDALCNALSCTPNDLIEFTPDPQTPKTEKAAKSKSNILQLKSIEASDVEKTLDTESAA